MEEKRMRKAFAEKLAFELRFEGSVDITVTKSYESYVDKLQGMF